jgi:hypothetical protein
MSQLSFSTFAALNKERPHCGTGVLAPPFAVASPVKFVNVETEFGREVLPQKIRTVLPDNFLKICEIGGICGFNFGI